MAEEKAKMRRLLPITALTDKNEPVATELESLIHCWGLVCRQMRYFLTSPDIANPNDFHTREKMSFVEKNFLHTLSLLTESGRDSVTPSEIIAPGSFKSENYVQPAIEKTNEEMAATSSSTGIEMKVKKQRDSNGYFRTDFPSFEDLSGSRFIKCVITHVNDPRDFFISPMTADSELQWQEFTNQMHKFYKREIQNVQKYERFQQSDLRVGTPCVAQYSKDRIWYRGVVLACFPEECHVLFVDFGNKEMVSRQKILPLYKQFGDIPRQAINVQLYGAKERNIDGEKWMSTFTDGDTMRFVFVKKIIRNQDDKWDVLMFDKTGYYVNEYYNGVIPYATK